MRRWGHKIGPATGLLKYLGVEYVVLKSEEGQDGPLREKAQMKVAEELRRINIGARCKERRRRMLQRHIPSDLAYGCAWTGFNQPEVLARKIEIAALGKRWHGRSVVAQWRSSIGVSLHPSFIRNYEAVRARVGKLQKIATLKVRAYPKATDAQREYLIAKATVEVIAEGSMTPVCQDWHYGG